MMFLKLILFVSFCFYCNVSQANEEKICTQNVTSYSRPSIIREYLFVGDMVKILLSNVKVAEGVEMVKNMRCVTNYGLFHCLFIFRRSMWSSTKR